MYIKNWEHLEPDTNQITKCCKNVLKVWYNGTPTQFKLQVAIRPRQNSTYNVGYNCAQTKFKLHVAVKNNLQIGYHWVPTRFNLQLEYNWTTTTTKLHVGYNCDPDTIRITRCCKHVSETRGTIGPRQTAIQELGSSGRR